MRFPQAMDMTQLSNAGVSADQNFLEAILVSMYTVCQTGARITSSIATTGVDVEALIAAVTELRAQGYTVAFPDATHITVAWQ